MIDYTCQKHISGYELKAHQSPVRDRQEPFPVDSNPPIEPAPTPRPVNDGDVIGVQVKQNGSTILILKTLLGIVFFRW